MIINKNRINYHNNDTRIKIGLHNHGNQLLRFCGIDDEIEEIEEKDMTTLEGQNLKLDFRAKLMSGKRLNVEGESKVVGEKVLKKAFDYSKEVYCQSNSEVISIILALAEGNNKKIYDKEYCTRFVPFLVEAKKMDGEKYLNIFKNKVENKDEFNEDDCGIFNLISEMKFKRNMNDVVIELCLLLKDAIIPENFKRELITIMNLNIDYYVAEEKQRNQLREMLKMDEVFVPEYNKMIRNSKKEGRKEGRKEGIEEGLDSVLDLISNNPNISVEDITREVISKKNVLNGK